MYIITIGLRSLLVVSTNVREDYMPLALLRSGSSEIARGIFGVLLSSASHLPSPHGYSKRLGHALAVHVLCMHALGGIKQ